jgi:hypothetical protein
MAITSYNGIVVNNGTTDATPDTYVEVFAPNPNRTAWYMEADPAAAASIVLAIGTGIGACVPILTLGAGLAAGDKFSNVITQGLYAKSTAASVAFNAYEKAI